MRFRSKIKLDIIDVFSYFILFSSIFNDILRIPNTKMSLFRMFSFGGIVLGIRYYKKLIKVLSVYATIAVITFLQSLYFIKISDFGLKINYIRYVEYEYYAFCIMIIILIINILFLHDGINFYKKMDDFLFFSVACYTFISALLYFYPRIKDILYINNVNDYASCLALLYPLIWKRFCVKKSAGCLILLGTIPVLCLLNDCKLAFFAIIVQLLVGLYYINREALKKFKVIVFIFFAFATIIAVYNLYKMNVVINGYNINEMLAEPLEHILKGEMYPASNTSMSYRTNVIIVFIKWIKKTKLLGIGFGNAGIMMKYELIKHGLYSTWISNEAISPHNSLLEFLVEFGWIACALFIKVIIESIKIIKKSKLDYDDIMLLMVVISAVLWLQGPSIIITDYLIFIGIIYYAFNNKSEIKIVKKVLDKFAYKKKLT